MQSFRQKLKEGFTLVESVIVMAVMTLVLMATHRFLVGGVGFYLGSVQSLEVQQQALVGLTRMVDEMKNSSLDKIYVPSPDNDAVVFPNPADLNGTISTNEKGVIVWQSITCYMKRTLADGSLVIERKAEAHPEVDYPPDPLTIVSGPRDIPYFAPLPATTVVARNVAIPQAGDPPSFQLVVGTDKITISLKIAYSHRNKDSVKLGSQVFPRN